jgi:ADP-dependent NAD(P)H-hydrate dehydratase
MSKPPPAETPAVTPQLLRDWPLPTPDDDGTKQARGTVCVVGGAVSTPGAVLLAGLAALRVGAGRLQVLTVEPTAVALGVAVPEAMVVGLPTSSSGSLSPSAADPIAEQVREDTTVVLGPGLLNDEDTTALVRALLPRLPCRRLVLDAHALTAVAGHEELVGDGAVLTPNDSELEALLGGEELSGRDGAEQAAKRYGSVVATKGWAVAPDGRAWRDEAGGVGLGTSGSGDVLAGAIGGLLARGAEPAQAAVWGQYAHAAAGDRLAARLGRLGFVARELLAELGPVLASLST